MVNYFDFHLPVNNPVALTGQVGGTISDDLVSSSLGELFSRVDTSDTGTLDQYRKVFIKQITNGSFSNLEIHLLNVEYTGQLSMVSEFISGDTSEGPTLVPDGYLSTSFSGHADNPVALGTSESGDFFGIWIRQTLDEDINNDDLASFIIQIKGDVI